MQKYSGTEIFKNVRLRRLDVGTVPTWESGQSYYHIHTYSPFRLPSELQISNTYTTYGMDMGSSGMKAMYDIITQ